MTTGVRRNGPCKRTAGMVNVLLFVLAGLGGAAWAGDPSQCQGNGGNLECKKADIGFVAQTGAVVGQSYADGTSACAAVVSNMSATYQAPLYWASYPLYGTGCEYAMYAGTPDAGRYFYQNWVLPSQQCAPAPWVPSWYDADKSEDARGRLWCQTDIPVEELSCKVGAPVLPGTGREAHSETDYAGAGAHPLEVTRQYRSFWTDGVTAGMAPVSARQGGWMLSVQTRVSAELPARLKPTRRVTRPSGSVVTFYGAGAAGGPQAWAAPEGQGDRLTEQRDAAGALTGWQYNVFADDSVESYDVTGRMLKVVQRNGWTTTLTYSTDTTPVGSYVTGGSTAQPGLLISVRNHFGRLLQFAYDPMGRIIQLLPPGAVKDSAAGSVSSPIRYSYDEPASLGAATPALGQLTSVTWQDGTVKRYHYEDGRFAHALTGSTDELGVRVVTRSYDAAGRVAEESKAGGADRLQFSYTPGSLGTGNQTTITDYSGSNGSATTRTYTFQSTGGVMRPTAVTAPCPLCGSTQASTTYDAGGRVTRSIAHDGSVTFRAYDAKGRETERATFDASQQGATTRPALSMALSVTSTQWHATWNLPTQVAEPGRTSAYTYSSKGNLTGQSWVATTDATGAAKFTAVKTGSTYATGWGYNASSLNTSVVEKVDAVETGRWTLAYNALGDLTRTTDVTRARTATMAGYDAHGRMLSGLTDAGVAIGLAYAPRGFVSSKTVSGQTVTFAQNAVGLTTQVNTPDGQTLTYDYDPTHSLTDVRLNGAAITPQMLASSDYPDTRLKAGWVRVKRGLQDGMEGLIPSAWAQSVTRLLFPVLVVPGRFMPGQPEFDPRTDMMTMAPMSPVDYAVRRFAEEVARACECKPSGGYSKPTFTLVTYAHVLFGGHLSPLFSDKSYFASTEKVGQALVDEVMAQGSEDKVRSTATRVVVTATLGRDVGYARTAASGFLPTQRVTVIYERADCSTRFRAGKEVITMHPESP